MEGPESNPRASEARFRASLTANRALIRGKGKIVTIYTKAGLFVLVLVAVFLAAAKVGCSRVAGFVAPPAGVVVRSGNRPCAHDSQGKMDYGMYVWAEVFNQGGDGNITVACDLMKGAGVWISRKKTVFLQAGTSTTFEWLITKELTLFGPEPDAVRIYVER